MIQSKPILQHTDAMHSDAFTGNLERASLLPGEIAAPPPVSQETRAAASAGNYAEPAGMAIYRRHPVDRKWPHRDGNHMTRSVARPWWYWPAITSLVALTAYGLILLMSDGAAGADISLLLHKLS